MSIKKRSYWLVLLLFCVLVAGIFYWVDYANSDSEFQWMIEPKFERANDFYKGVAWVSETQSGPSKLIDKRGNIIIDNFQGNVDSFIDGETGLIAFQLKYRHHGYINLSGDIVISPDYQWVDSFRNGVASVKKDDFYGVIDDRGEMVLPCMYEGLYVIDSNLFTVKKDEKWGLINAKGETVVDFTFKESVGRGLPGASIALLNDKRGLIGHNGEWILPASYDHFYPPIRHFLESKGEPIGVAKDGKVGFVNAKGNVVIDFQFKATEEGTFHFYRFSEGLAPVILPARKNEDGEEKFGVIDRTGKVLFELPGSPRGWFSEGYMMVFRPAVQRYGLVDRDGNWHSLPLNIGPEVIWGAVSDGMLRVNKRTEFNRLGNRGYVEIRNTER